MAMLQLRKTFACFSRQDDDDDDEQEEGQGGPRRRWTHGRKRLRQRSPEELLGRLARDVEVLQQASNLQQQQQPSLVLSTEMLAFLAQHVSHPPATSRSSSSRSSSGSTKKNTLALQTLHSLLASLPALRLVEQDRRRSHPCDGLRPSLYPSLITLELTGVTPSALAPALPALRPTLQTLRVERAALCGLDELLLSPPPSSSPHNNITNGDEEEGLKPSQWTSLERLVLSHCDLGDLHPASALAHSCPRLTRLELPHNRLVSIAGLLRAWMEHGEKKQREAASGRERERGSSIRNFLPTLALLDLRHNAIQSVACLSSSSSSVNFLAHLQELRLGHNQLHSTQGLEAAFLPSLHTLDLSHNALARWGEVERLDDDGRASKEGGREGSSRVLEALRLEGNPLAGIEGYRLKVLALLRRGGGVRVLDGLPPSEAEKRELQRRLTHAVVSLSALPLLVPPGQEQEKVVARPQQQREDGTAAAAAATTVEKEREGYETPVEEETEESWRPKSPLREEKKEEEELSRLVMPVSVSSPPPPPPPPHSPVRLATTNNTQGTREAMQQHQQEHEETQPTSLSLSVSPASSSSSTSSCSSSPASVFLEDGQAGESGEVTTTTTKTPVAASAAAALPPPLPVAAAAAAHPPPAAAVDLQGNAIVKAAKGKNVLVRPAAAASSSLSSTFSSPSSPTSSSAAGAKQSGRPRRVAVVEEGEVGLEGGEEGTRASVEDALATPPPFPPPLHPAETKEQEKKQKKKQKKKERGEEGGGEGLEGLEDRMVMMRQELAALEARLALAREEIGRVVERKTAVLQGAGGGGKEEKSGKEVDYKAAPAKTAVTTYEEVGEEEEVEPAARRSQQQQQEYQRPATVLTRHLPSVLVMQQQQQQQQQQEGDDKEDDDDDEDEEVEKEVNGNHSSRTSSSSSSEHNALSTSSSSSSSVRRFLSPHDLDSIRAFLVEQHVFGSLARSASPSMSFFTPSTSSSFSPASLTACFETDPGRALFHSLALPCPEKLIHLYQENCLVDVRRRSGRTQDILGRETSLLLALTDQHLYLLDPSFAAPHPSGHLKHFSEAPLPVLLGRWPLRALERVVVGFRAQWGRLEFEVEGKEKGSRGRDSSSWGKGEGGGQKGECVLLRQARREGDPIVQVGYTLVTRDKAQTFRLLNGDLRPLANEARRRGREGGREDGRQKEKQKVEVANTEEAGMEALVGAGVRGVLRYHAMLFQWSKKRKGLGLPLLPRTVMVTEEGELVVAVEDLRQDVSLPLPISVHAVAAAVAAGDKGLFESGVQQQQQPQGKFSPVPAVGKRLSVLLRVPLSQVLEVSEEAGDPRHITLTVQGGGGGEGWEGGLRGRLSLLPFLGTHTWRLYSEDRRQIEALTKLLLDRG